MMAGREGEVGPGADHLRGMVADVADASRRMRVAWVLARSDVFSRVRLTTLGPIWLVIQPLIWIVAILVLIRPAAASEDPLFPLYVSIGIVLFLGMQTFMVGGAYLFKRERNRILNVPLPLSVFVFKNAIAVALELAVMAPIVLGALSLVQPAPGSAVLLVLPGLLVYLVFGIGITLCLSVLAARFADVVFVVQAGMRVMLFLTPIFWLPERMTGPRFFVAQFNPLHHVILVVRDPLMGRVPDAASYATALACAVAALATGLFVFARFRQRIAVWI